MDGKVIGWFNGRAEFGPRALGGRSIIVDPSRLDAKDLLNSKIKRRESFRPFAPSILSEHVADWFELDEPVPFMEKVFPIREERKGADPGCDTRGWLWPITIGLQGRHSALSRSDQRLSCKVRRAHSAQHELQRKRAHRQRS